VNSERVGRLLLAFAGALGLLGMALADSRAQYGRYLGLSGCLIMVALAVLLLAPRPTARVERRARPARRSSDRVATAAHRVPRQRTAVTSRSDTPAEPGYAAAGPCPVAGAVGQEGTTRAA
jgi:uncharacterized membrane protein YedE/YeeE